MALVATSIYTLDRVVRFTRYFYYLPSNTATLTPLPGSNATRVTLSRSMPRAAPGSHAFLYIPSIRMFQTHPFTMMNREPIEFVVSARDGFTKALFAAACENPGRRVKAAVEGAYGCVPDATGYDRTILFAGGSGATFSFAMATEWARNHAVEDERRLDLVWSVRTAGETYQSSLCVYHELLIRLKAHLAAFKPELDVLEAHPRITVRVHMTQSPKSTPMSPPSDPPSPPIRRLKTICHQLRMQVLIVAQGRCTHIDRI